MTLLPPDAALRTVLHNEVHARPSAHIPLPALVVLVAVFNDGVSREDEWAHLCRLSPHLTLEALQGNFVRLDVGHYTLKWERHTEFTRYSLVLPWSAAQQDAVAEGAWLNAQSVPHDWLAAIPGTTFAAIEVAMLHDPVVDSHAALHRATALLDTPHMVVASCMGTPVHSMVATDFQLRPSGFERMVVLAPEGTSASRAGRISQRLLELETYRLMALRGLPVAKAVGAQLGLAERGLATITAELDNKSSADQTLLDNLVGLAATVELITAEHAYRFSATRAYDNLVRERITELRETPISGTQSIGQFMQRRLSPAMATVASTSHRLGSLSERVSRASALLRTRVDIATETQNQQLLEQLTKGQALQLRLQSTVEGLSIAAISYYVVSLLLYASKAAQASGVPIHPEMAVGALIPVVVLGVWRINKRIHAKMRTP